MSETQFSLPKKSGSRSGGIRARNYDLANTNIAGLGTDLEKQVRKAAAETEDAWQGAGKVAGLQIWRIEKFQVKPWPKEKYGRFFSGDSYIILHTYHRQGQGALKWDAHFWIGRDSSQDEYGTAAYKTVELDDYLDGYPTQYREVQDHESCRFKALFKQLIYMDGGIGTGFRSVEEEVHRNRLLHCKGRMNVLVKEVPLTYKSLNSGDSFIFDGGDRIYVWHGRESGPMEKAKAANIAQALDDERAGTPRRETFDEGLCNMREWWHALNGEGPVRTKDEAAHDDDVNIDEKRLMRVSDADGEIKMDLVAQGAGLRRDVVTSDDVFILDDGYEVMVWIGKNASIRERKSALCFAVEYLKRFNLDLDKPIVRLMEGGENEQFEAAFEVGVLSTVRPGEQSGAKFSANISKFQGHSKPVAKSMMGDYKGSGGPGAATDLDAFYESIILAADSFHFGREQGVDPTHWKGRTKSESAFAKELEAAKIK